MNYDSITLSYATRQSRRITRVVEILKGRKTVVGPGRVIPADGVLPIGVGRRLDAAILFIDICDSSSVPAESLEEQDRILRSYTLLFSEMIAIIEDYDGTVEKNTGDGLMAYFTSDSVATDAKKAVACVLTIFRTVDIAINPLIIEDGGARIEFRATIDRGPVTIAEVGAPRGFRGAVAIGTTANIASKMQAHAGAMELILGEAACAALPEDWRTRFLRIVEEKSGWQYRTTGNDYPLYRYQGRWTAPTDDNTGWMP